MSQRFLKVTVVKQNISLVLEWLYNITRSEILSTPMLMCELAKAMHRLCKLIMQNSLLTLVGAIWHRAQRTKACSFRTFQFTESLFLVPARIILPLFLRCQGLPCLQRLLGQDDDSHMLFTAGLEAPLKHQHMNIHDHTSTRKWKSWIYVPVYDGYIKFCPGCVTNEKQFGQP